mmetsp:Transcript_19520/g.58993  ORF Transcript_19520/g.58993 Transcript_19520/m.58993 type:complete len:107 (-) Transcript_19520:1547-1867(-)|eukprot:CAMPEP_0206134976 /NCGR_PEP_ID=MMETSP1473-20131121/358_1 /ASSEMBLY_ACC=CAM_ASM_001109 /TAXON_ID=1461547 /ORGANISM="Stichococcus sp, Strain RCC1054" /LENGTH=106 /DNA_ID=CAMNT_0053526647 /DNA_START=187 /DNA_END=507 /DNA_ORIENTATION=-
MASPAQKLRAIHLYRHTLKNVISWCVRRDIFWEEAERIRGLFEKNAHVKESQVIDGLLRKGEAELYKHIHPDPIIVPYFYGGTMYQRNPPFPKEMHQVMDFGREGH